MTIQTITYTQTFQIKASQKTREHADFEPATKLLIQLLSKPALNRSEFWNSLYGGYDVVLNGIKFSTQDWVSFYASAALKCW